MTPREADLLILEMEMANICSDSSDYFEESGAYDIVKTISSAIKKLVIKMEAWLKKTKVDIDVMILEHQKSKRFKELENLILNTPNGKKKTIKFLDVGGAVLLYQKYMKGFEKDLKKILSKSFTKYSEKDSKNLNYQITMFESSLDEFDRLVDDTLTDTIEMKGDEALRYIRECKKGIEPVYKYYFNMIRMYDRFRIDAEKELLYKVVDTNAELRANVYKTKALMSKMSTKASSVARKILMKVVWWTA